jgi:hypothetical protein
MHPVDQPVGFKEDLSIFRDTKRAQLVYMRTAVRRRSERFCRLNEPIEDVVSASSGIVLSDVKVDLFQGDSSWNNQLLQLTVAPAIRGIRASLSARRRRFG